MTKNFDQEIQTLISWCEYSSTQKSQKKRDVQKGYLPHNRSTNERLLALASKHALLPLAYQALQKIDGVSPSQLEPWERAYRYIVQKNMMTTAKLFKISKLLNDNNIEVVSFKGATLAQLAYGNITLRQYGDIDILIDEKDLSRASNILLENNYSAQFPTKIINNRVCLDKLIDVTFLDNATIIELHWRLLLRRHTGEKSLMDSSSFRQSIAINSKNLITLSSELLLVYLSIHGSKHMWERIGWICDVDRVVRAQSIDWERVVSIAQRSKLRKSLYLGLRLSEVLFYTPLPEHIKQQIRDENLERLTALIISRHGRGNILEENSTSYRELFLFHLKLFDSTRDKFLFILDTLFGVSPADCMHYALPNQLKILYIFLRPLRLAMKLGKLK